MVKGESKDGKKNCGGGEVVPGGDVRLAAFCGWLGKGDGDSARGLVGFCVGFTGLAWPCWVCVGARTGD